MRDRRSNRLWPMLLLAGLAGAAPAGELDDLLRQVQESRAEAARTDEARKARFLADKNQQQKLLNDTRAALAKAEADSKALRAEFAANGARIGELKAELKQRGGELNEVSDAVRQFAAQFKPELEHSLVAAQFPGRGAALDPLIAAEAIPTGAQLENLWLAVLQEMTEAGKTVRFSGRISDAAGMDREAAITRVGNFSAVANGEFLRLAPETGKLAVLPRQPEGEYLALANHPGAGPDGFAKLAVDPTRGTVLDGYAKESPAPFWLPKSLKGLVSNEIDLAVLGLLLLASLWALAVAAERWLCFRRVDLAGFRSRLALETELSRHLTVIGTVAANAPFVGLLGTVLGIMMTFQKMGMEKGHMDVHSIMIGLSTALKATALGLLVAIPCVILNNALRRRIRELATAWELRHG